jgi:hypothetical protein
MFIVLLATLSVPIFIVPEAAVCNEEAEALKSRYLLVPPLFCTVNKLDPMPPELSLIMTPKRVESRVIVLSVWLAPFV